MAKDFFDDFNPELWENAPDQNEEYDLEDILREFSSDRQDSGDQLADASAQEVPGTWVEEGDAEAPLSDAQEIPQYAANPEVEMPHTHGRHHGHHRDRRQQEQPTEPAIAAEEPEQAAKPKVAPMPYIRPEKRWEAAQQEEYVQESFLDGVSQESGYLLSEDENFETPDVRRVHEIDDVPSYFYSDYSEEKEEPKQRPSRRRQKHAADRYAAQDAVDRYGDQVQQTIEQAPEAEEEDADETEHLGFFSRIFAPRQEDDDVDLEEADGEDAEAWLDEEPDELGLIETSNLYGAKIRSLRSRSLLGFLISVISAYMALAYELSWPLPAFLRDNGTVLSGVSLIFLLLCMFCNITVVTIGLRDIAKAQIGAETLVVVAAIAAVIDSVCLMISGNTMGWAPFGAVVSFALTFATIGTKVKRNAYKLTFRTAAAAANPSVVTLERNQEDGSARLEKSQGEIRRFITKAEELDCAEQIFSYAAPLMIIAALVFALLCGIIHGDMWAFSHAFSSMLAIGASFSCLLAYGLPFSYLAKRLMKSGAAIAGWSGACDVHDASAVVITDSDLFPDGSLAINGVKIYAGHATSKVIAYTGSLIAYSGSELEKVFSELMSSQGCAILPVEDFSCYEGGGLGAMIKMDQVLVGSSGFMNLMGIRVPSNLNVKNAVFTALNGELAGVFSINYTPVNSVRHALVRLLGAKIAKVFAVRDFNITPLMLKQKFKFESDDMEFPSVEERYALSGGKEPSGRTLAVLCREGLAPLSETVTGGLRFYQVAKVNTWISVIGAVLGLLLMFYMCWAGAFGSVTNSNILIYSALWLVPILLLSGEINRY